MSSPARDVVRPMPNAAAVRLRIAPASGSNMPPRKWGRGGWRPGAGAKPKGAIARVDHRAREQFAGIGTALVSMRLKGNLPALRRQPANALLLLACAEGFKAGTFRVKHFVLRDDRLHLLVEADGRRAMTRGLQGLFIRMARALNKLWARHGKVFADRYEDRLLETPREERSVLRALFADSAPAAKGSCPSARRSIKDRAAMLPPRAAAGFSGESCVWTRTRPSGGAARSSDSERGGD